MDVLIFYLVFGFLGIMHIGTSYGRKIFKSDFNYGYDDLVKIDPNKRQIEILSKDNVNNAPESVTKYEKWHNPKFHDLVKVDPNKRQIEIFAKDNVNNAPESVTKYEKWHNPKFHDLVKVDPNKRQIEIFSQNGINPPVSVTQPENWYGPKFHDLVKVDSNERQIEILSKDNVNNPPESVTKYEKWHNPKIHDLVKVDPNKRQIEIFSKNEVNPPASVTKPENWYDPKFHDLVKVDPNKRQIEILSKDNAINPPESVTKHENLYSKKFHDLVKIDPNRREIEIMYKDSVINPASSTKPAKRDNPKFNELTKFDRNKKKSDSKDVIHPSVPKPTKWHNPKIVHKYNIDQTISSNLNVYEPKGSSMNIGEHLIKVSSHLHSKQPDTRYPETLSNSKYHVIEIIPNEVVSEQTMPESDFSLQDAGVTDSTGSTNIGFESTESSIHLRTVNDKNELNINEVTIAARAGNEGEESPFSDEFQGSGEDSFNAEDFKNGFGRERSERILGAFSRQNGTAPTCTTPKNETGRCRRFRNCLLSDALNNFNVFLQYLCLVRGAIVGMCCPDNPVIEIVNSDENSTESDTGKDIKQPPEGCGLNTKTRVVGGTISVPHEWSWMVALMRRNRFFCGGVIINNWYVLTAAHCVLGVEVKDLTVRLGEYNFSTNNEHREDLSVSEIKRHAQFVTLTFQHDIALLKLRRSINYTKFVGSICIPSLISRDYSDVSGTVVGWGTVSFGGAASPVLRQVTIPVWKNEDCDKTYLLENISDSFLCAGSPEKGEDACQGDSGGPLMALNDRGRWEVIGLVSWGRRCGDPTYPGVYTRITTYMDWIAQNAT